MTATGHSAKEKGATNVKKKKRLFVSLSLCGALLATVGVILLAMPGCKPAPPDRDSHEDGTSASSVNEICVFGDTEREHFLIYFKSSIHEDTLTGNETPVETARIKKKNAKIRDYTAYVENLYGKSMPKEEFDAHYRYLAEAIAEIYKLDERLTPEKQLALRAGYLAGVIDEDLYYARITRVGFEGGFIGETNRDIPLMEESHEKLQGLYDALENHTLIFEDALEKYAAAVDLLKVGNPTLYKMEKEKENRKPIESLMEKPAYAPPPRNASKTMA